MSGNGASTNMQPLNDSGSLRSHQWKRFIRGPDSELLERLYVPGLSEAVRYDRCCAYFSSSVLATAARGFAGMINRLIILGDTAPKPAVRLVVNEEMLEEDVNALIETGDTSRLEEILINRLNTPKYLLEKQRLAMLSWLAKKGLLEIRVGVMRRTSGIVHAKFGVIYDVTGDAIVFNGSGNESASGVKSNYERLEVSTSWSDRERFEEYKDEFELLWEDKHPDVHIVSLPYAVHEKLITFSPHEPPTKEPMDSIERRKSAMLWRFIAESAYLPNGASSCDATAPIASLWPHQRAVIEEVTDAWPDGRLLCDEVGMGKTIEAIMIIRRLLAGRGVQRVLLLLPAGLTNQWQEELREKGGLIVPRLINTDTLAWPDGRCLKVSGLGEALEKDLLIMSRETARMEDNRSILLAAKPWDLVLLDEAHAARRAKQEEGEFNSATLLLELLRQMQMRRQAKSFLLLSATPMQTAPWEPWDLLAILGEGGAWISDFTGVRSFYNLIHTLGGNKPPTSEDAYRSAWLICKDKNFPPPVENFQELSSPEDGKRRLRFMPPALKPRVAEWLRSGSPLARRMHRNTRRTLWTYYELGLIDGQPSVRRVIDWPYDFQPSDGLERNVYDAVTRYIDRRFDILESEEPGKGFVMTIYRRRAASSFQALKCSLERRLDGLRRAIKFHAISGYVDYADGPAGFYDDDLSDLGLQSISAAIPSNPDEARAEADEVELLISQLDMLGSTDTKRDRLFDLIHQFIGEERSVLIFTEYTDTMEYLRKQLALYYDERVASYCGGGGCMLSDGKWNKVTKTEITDALIKGKIQFLVCTDAASEGLNLQTASALVNYDLPWNPSKVEQRIGRIDRIGQKRLEIKIFNFFLINSIDERVYNVLRGRCGVFERFVGPMQPVLARAKVMLTNPKDFSLDELNTLADEVENNFLIKQTYMDSKAIILPSPVPSVTKDDIHRSLGLLVPEFDIHIVGKDLITIHGLNNTATISMDNNLLDLDPNAQPLTCLSPLVNQIANHLERPGEQLPLVFEAYSAERFRSSYCIWISHGGLESIETMDDLKSHLAAWDGVLPDSGHVDDAKRYARRKAEEEVKRMKARAEKKYLDGYLLQRQAAAIRTARELGRLVKCLSPEGVDIKTEIDIQAHADKAISKRINDSMARIGDDFDWSDYLKWELAQFIEGSTPNERRSRLSGSSMDAALDDYRWQSGK